ncbi:MAG: hypothetical protein ACKOBN_01180 [Flavobacteriales bacterium]
MKFSIKSLLPHLIAVLLFVILPSIYFSPVYQGYTLKQSDIRQFQGMSKEIFDHKLANDGKQTMWTNAMFGGMPSYQISATQDSNLLTTLDQAIKLGLPRPVGILFISMLGFYILGLCLRINPWLAMIGALGYGFSTINILYLGAGHMSKVNAIAYMAPALGGLILAFRGKWLLGAAIFALFMGLNISANHLQMTYYLAFILVAVSIAETVRLVIEKQWLGLTKTIGALALASILALVSNAGLLLPTLEYSKYTTRGTSELTIKSKTASQSLAKEGLASSYILEYNYGKNELLSIYAPNAKGGKNDYISNNPEALANTDYNYAEQVGQMDQYWGGQSMSGGAFYFGVIMLVFFVLGLLFVKDALRWPFLVLSVLTLYLASNQMNFLNDFFIHHFPMYNKFRDSKMMLVLIQIMVPALGLLFFDRLLKSEGLLGQKKHWFIGMGALLVVSFVLMTSPSISGDFLSAREVQQFAEASKQAKDPSQITYYQGLRQALIDTRIGIYKADMQRSFFLVILALGLVFILIRTQMNRMLILALAGIIVLADQLSVAKRYLNNDDSTGSYKSYQTEDEASVPYAVSVADLSILGNEKVPASLAQKLKAAYANFEYYKKLTDQQTLDHYAAFGALNLSSSYRVLNVNGTMAETNTSFFHKSIGGYHGAKLKRYQEFVDFHFPSAVGALNTAMNTAKNEKFRTLTLPAGLSQEQAQKIFDTLGVASVQLNGAAELLNMLNTKYVILNPNQKAVMNNSANGPAWFVQRVKIAKDANEEMTLSAGDQLGSSKLNAVVHAEFKNQLVGLSSDSTAQIKLTSYDPAHMSYLAQSKTKQLALFSEIYYPAGWNCYIDGKKPVETLRANYILRGVVVPAGKHKIEWKFEPVSVSRGDSLSAMGSGLLLLGFLLSLYFTFRKSKVVEA